MSGFDEVIADLLRAEDGDDRFDHEILLARYPQHADDLRRFFADEALFSRHLCEDSSGDPSPPPSVPDPGHRASTEIHAQPIAGYELIREIHRGGQGVVYETLQQSTRRRVAVKVMREWVFAGTAERARFQREVHILAQLHHPNIVSIHDSGETAGLYYFVMDFIEGKPFDRWHEEWGMRNESSLHSQSGKNARLRSVIALLVKVCDAVNIAHARGIVHRDLKPGNILVTSDNEPHILDFGLAKAVRHSLDSSSSGPTLTLTGQFIGTIHWTSPEQAAGKADVDPRSDVYSLGVLLYHGLTGKLPYPDEGSVHQILDLIVNADPIPPRKLGKHLPGDVNTIILKCLGKNPQRRYATAGELASDLRCFLTGEPISAKRDSTFYVLGKVLKRRRRAAAALAVLALSFVAVGYLTWRTQHSQQRMISMERHDALEDALVAALNGQTAEAETCIRRATAAGASPGRIHLLHGLSLINQSRHAEALDDLEAAVRLAPESVAAWALLALAHFDGGSWDQFFPLLDRLEAMQPRTSEDYLFKGWAEFFGDAQSAVVLANMDQAIRLRDSSLARILRAGARSRAALASADGGLADLALEDAIAAKSMLPDSLQALTSHVLTGTNAARIFAMSGQSERAAQVLQQLNPSVSRLAEFQGRTQAHWARAVYYDYRGRAEEALEELRYSNPKLYAADLYARGQYEAALDYLDESDAVAEDTQYDTVRAYLVMPLSNGVGLALERHKAINLAEVHGLMALYPQTILRLSGHGREAVESSRAIRGQLRALPDYLRSWYETLLDYNGERISAEDLLEAASDSSGKRCEAHYFIGLALLAEGDRLGARAHFKAAVENKNLGYFDWHWSRAFLAHLDRDPQWPPWINPSESTTNFGNERGRTPAADGSSPRQRG